MLKRFFHAALWLAVFVMDAQAKPVESEIDPVTLAVTLVAYIDDDGAPVVGEEEAEEAFERVNRIWRTCGIAFRVEKYLPVRPAAYGLKYRLSDYADLSRARRKFQDPVTLLIALTGPWDRKGSLGNTKANAWTAMPGSGPYGAILEKPVARNGGILAHELGHYLNLLHVADDSAVMNAIIYQRSARVTEEQCREARSAAKLYWSKAVR